MSADDNRELIVQKNKAFSNPDRGDVNILFVLSEDGKKINTPSPVEFPTKSIFISKEFEELDTKFKKEQLLRLQIWKRNEDEWKEGEHRHWAFGSTVKSIERSTFIPIHEGDLPNKETGQIKIYDLPINEPFFIKKSAFIYGPFTTSAKQEDGIQKASPYSQTILGVQNNYILKISQKTLNSYQAITPTQDQTENQTIYITSLKTLSTIPKEKKEEMDFISNENLVTYFSKFKLGAGKKTLYSRKEADRLKRVIAEAIDKKTLKEGERLSRLNDIFEKYLDESDIGNEITNQYFKSQDGEKYLKKYIEKTPSLASNASKEIKDEITILEENRDRIKSETHLQIRNQEKKISDAKNNAIKTIEDEKEEARTKIEEIRKKSKKELEDERNKSLGELKSEITELENKKKKLGDEIKSFIDTSDEIKNINEIKLETNHLERTKNKLERAVEAQKEILGNPDLTKKITEVKTVTDILQGRSPNENHKKYLFNSPKLTKITPNLDDASQYIQKLVDYFDGDGHSISFEEITNLIVNIQQSFLTVLSGLPGSGKTSSITRLSIAHGLCSPNESQSDCFLNIPVARGWVSSRDFVGFNNSLKGIFQPAKTGMYQFLKQGNLSDSNNFLRMIMLDEANLSPIEHYWSEFLAMCDKEGRNRPLDTGQQGDDRLLHVNENIRFIATINNDNTTEPLSPRLCDRAPIITMDIPYISNVSEDIASLTLDGAIPYNDLEKWFGIPSESDSELPPIIDEFCNKMKESNFDLGSEIYISQRKLNAMTSYCEVAQKYIEPIIAIDFALSQHALPLINGHGEDFKKRLQALGENAKSNNLIRTEFLINKILRSGEKYIDSYSFF